MTQLATRGETWPLAQFETRQDQTQEVTEAEKMVGGECTQWRNVPPVLHRTHTSKTSAVEIWFYSKQSRSMLKPFITVLMDKYSGLIAIEH